MKCFLFVIVLCLISLNAKAQTVTRIVNLGTPPPSDVNNKTKPSAPKLDAKFISLAAAMQAATVLDMESTFSVAKNCSACREANPFLRPLVNSGRPATYAVTTGIDLAAFYVAYRMRKDGKRYWWVPMVAATGLHAGFAWHNYRLLK